MRMYEFMDLQESLIDIQLLEFKVPFQQDSLETLEDALLGNDIRLFDGAATRILIRFKQYGFEDRAAALSWLDATTGLDTSAQSNMQLGRWVVKSDNGAVDKFLTLHGALKSSGANLDSMTPRSDVGAKAAWSGSGLVLAYFG